MARRRSAGSEAVAASTALEADYRDRVIAHLRPRLELIISRLADAGAPLPDPDDLAIAMATAVPMATTRSDYDQLIGPFYSSSAVMTLLGVPTKQALDDRRRRGTILAARTSDGVWVYPVFQFDDSRRKLVEGLVPVLAALKPAPRWGAALWLVTPQPSLRDQSPLQACTDNGLSGLVRRLATEYATAVTA